MNDQVNNARSINLAHVFSVFKKKYLKILLNGVIFGLLVFIISFVFLIPQYSATIDLLVNQRTDDKEMQYNIHQADLQAINTYKDVLNKPVILNSVLNEVKHKDNYQGNLDSLKDSISIENETNSQVFSVTVKNDNPYVAADIANTIGNVFSKKIKKMMKVDNVTIVTTAKPNNKAVFPNNKILIGMGFLLGVIGSSIWFFAKDALDTKVRSDQFLTQELGLVNLGQIGHISNKNSLHAITIRETNQSKNISSRRV